MRDRENKDAGSLEPASLYFGGDERESMAENVW